MASYDYIDQDIIATTLILMKDNDSFYHPQFLGHTGFAADGTHYTDGIQDLAGSPPGPVFASWHTETLDNVFRGDQGAFPNAGLILLSKAAMTILDETTSALSMWMLFMLADAFALANNFNGQINGFTPYSLAYADGVVSVGYTPDPGAAIQSNLVISVDFVQDSVYLDVAV